LSLLYWTKCILSGKKRDSKAKGKGLIYISTGFTLYFAVSSGDGELPLL